MYWIERSLETIQRKRGLKGFMLKRRFRDCPDYSCREGGLKIGGSKVLEWKDGFRVCSCINDLSVVVYKLSLKRQVIN